MDKCVFRDLIPWVDMIATAYIFFDKQKKKINCTFQLSASKKEPQVYHSCIWNISSLR